MPSGKANPVTQVHKTLQSHCLYGLRDATLNFFRCNRVEPFWRLVAKAIACRNGYPGSCFPHRSCDEFQQ